MKSYVKFVAIFTLISSITVLTGIGAWTVYRKIGKKDPMVIEEARKQRLSQRILQISKVSWQDSRPLNVIIGDSHAEYADWYGLTLGSCAIRNAGFATASIEEVTEVTLSIPDRDMATVLLFCGINNLGAGNSPEYCIEQYRKLIEAVRTIRPQKLVVINIMPVRTNPLDPKPGKTNHRVKIFNRLLLHLCKDQNIEYVDIASLVEDSNGGLADRWTVDGLHLNPAGYAIIAPSICNHFKTDSPEY